MLCHGTLKGKCLMLISSDLVLFNVNASLSWAYFRGYHGDEIGLRTDIC